MCTYGLHAVYVCAHMYGHLLTYVGQKRVLEGVEGVGGKWKERRR